MRRAKRIWIGGVAVTAVLVLAVAIPALRPRCIQVAGDDRVLIPIADLARGAASFFCYRDAAGDHLRFILARDDEGHVHSVMDACHQCYNFHKGYAVSSNGEVVCRLCGNKYSLKGMEAGKASCVPVALPNRQHDGMVEVKVADLKQQRQLF
jgi:uncharacterized membrane protein